MDEFNSEQARFVKLACGCILHEDSAELYEECLSHLQAYFIQ